MTKRINWRSLEGDGKGMYHAHMVRLANDGKTAREIRDDIMAMTDTIPKDTVYDHARDVIMSITRQKPVAVDTSQESELLLPMILGLSAAFSDTVTPSTIMRPQYGKEVALFDLHYPHHNKQAWDAFLKCLKAIKPNVLILGGDILDNAALSHWNKSKIGLLAQMPSPGEMYKDFNKDVLLPLRRIVGNSCYIAYLLGNHEDWVRLAEEGHPHVRDYRVDRNVDCVDEIIQYVRSPEELRRGIHNHFNLGKLYFIHGYATNQYHARKIADEYNRPIRYGHMHDIQTYTHRTAVDVGDFHVAKCCGCMCDLYPSYGRNRPNGWVHAFQSGEVLQDGSFSDDVHVIVDGKFRANGKWYGV